MAERCFKKPPQRSQRPQRTQREKRENEPAFSFFSEFSENSVFSVAMFKAPFRLFMKKWGNFDATALARVPPSGLFYSANWQIGPNSRSHADAQFRIF